MKLREREIYAGQSLEYEAYPVTKKGYRRDGKNKMSSAAQKNLNLKNATKRLGRLINANFISGDLILTLQYRKEIRPKNEKQILRDIQNFIRRLKRYIKSNSISQFQLKYIYTIEVTDNNNWHTHMIVSKIDRNILKKLWRYSDRVWVKEYNPQKYGGGESLAKYLMGCKGNKKFTKGNWRSWNSSKNLLKPTVIIKDSGLSRAQTAQIARDRIDDRNFWEKRYEGYRFVSATPIFNDWNGWWYIYVKLYKPPE